MRISLPCQTCEHQDICTARQAHLMDLKYQIARYCSHPLCNWYEVSVKCADYVAKEGNDYERTQENDI